MMIIARGRPQGGIKTVKKPRLSLVTTIAEATGTTSVWRNFLQYGNYVIASGTVGVNIIDVSTPSASAVVGTCAAPGVRDCCIIGTNLYTAERLTTGEINEFDLSTVTGAHTATANSYAGTPKYSAIATDGTNLIVSGQQTGYYKFTAASVSTGPAASYETDNGPTGTIETQGCDVSGGYAFFANYDHGLTIFDVATWGSTTYNTVDAPTLNAETLRLWEVVVDGNYLYATTNTTGSDSDTERGIVILDITDPTAAMTASDWVIASVGANDVDTWNGAGDKPLMGLCKVGDYIYAGNGQKGVAVWHVANPLKPAYMGLVATNIDSGDNITAIGSFKIAQKNYLIYGDGPRSNATDGTDKIYISEIIL